MGSPQEAGTQATPDVWVLVVDDNSGSVVPPMVCTTQDLARQQADHVAESYGLSFGHWIQSGGGTCLTAEGPTAVFRIYRRPVRAS